MSPRRWWALTPPFHPYRTPHRVMRRMAVSFLCHFPSAFAAWGFPSALPCGVRTFLGPRRGPQPPGLHRQCRWLVDDSGTEIDRPSHAAGDARATSHELELHPPSDAGHTFEHGAAHAAFDPAVPLDARRSAAYEACRAPPDAKASSSCSRVSSTATALTAAGRPPSPFRGSGRARDRAARRRRSRAGAAHGPAPGRTA